jgi:hypothetical protein
MDNGRLQAFLKDPLMKELGNFQLEQTAAKKNDGDVKRSVI